MRTLSLPPGGSPRSWGRLHGESFRGEIGSLAAIRIHLACRISGFDEAALLRVAERHLPVLEAYDAALCEELLGIAEGAGLPPAAIVVLNHYTDLRDLSPGDDGGGEVDFDGGCTMLFSRPRADTGAGPVFAQTWDMHATATPYMMMLRVPAASGGDAWLLSLTGCLGMAGLSRAGVCVGINNLTSTDARIGVVWSAVVRKILQQDSAAAARDLVLGSPLGSGHHYLVADEREAFGIETSGTRRAVVYAGDGDFVHANHCQDESVAAASRVPAASTTFARETALRADLSRRPIESADDAWLRLGSTDGYPASVCTNMSTPENPHAAATCAALSIDLGARVMLAAAGMPHGVTPERFDFDEAPAPAGVPAQAERKPYFFTWSAQRHAEAVPLTGGDGAFYTTADGARWLDLGSLSYQASLGHGHPRMIAAIAEQAASLCVAPPSADFPAKRELAEALLALAPPGFGRVFFTVGGAEAIENAMKIARLATGRHKFVSRYRSYHGASFGALSLTGDFRRPPLEPGLGGVSHVLRDADIPEVLEHEGGVAAVVLEAVPGANGVHITPSETWQDVRSACDHDGALLIVDEVLTGFGRTGRAFGVEHFGVVPDLITVAKALTGGYAPLGAVLVSDAIAARFDDEVLWAGLTSYGHPLGCAAGREALRLYREGDLYARAARLEPHLLDPLRALCDGDGPASGARGLGLLAAIDLDLSPAAWARLGAELRARHLSLHLSSRRKTAIFAPPLVIDEDDLDRGMADFADALRAAV